MAPKEIAAVAECLLCQSHIVVTVAKLNPEYFEDRPGWRGKPADRQAEWLLELQEKITRMKYLSMPCPYCISLIEGTSHPELSDVPLINLFPQRFVSFDQEEDPPLYINSAADGEKKRWVLCQGVGPKRLELDKSQLKVYKKSYRASGLDGPFLTSVEVMVFDQETKGTRKDPITLPPPDVIRSLSEEVEQCWWKADEKAPDFMKRLFAHFFPALLKWCPLKNDVLSMVSNDPYQGLVSFFETYPDSTEAEEGGEESGGGDKSTSKSKKGAPPPPMRENRPRGQKREERRYLANDVRDEYDCYEEHERWKGKKK